MVGHVCFYRKCPSHFRAERSQKDYAIEFGEYLAKSAEFMLKAHECAVRSEALLGDCELTHDAYECLGEARNHLESAIYEFRKRAAKAEK